MTRSPFVSATAPVCPPDLLIRAQETPNTVVAIAAAGAALPMQAAFEASQANIMTPLFCGEPDKILCEAKALSWDISKFEIIEAEGEDAAAQAAATACGEGRAGILMKGHLHTDSFMKAALARDAGLRTGERLVHIFHISHPTGGKPLLVSDAAVNVNPNIVTRQDALKHMTNLLIKLGNPRPKIAILSATESVIESVPSSVEADQLAKWADTHLPQADVAGPLAIDGILSPEAAQIKGLTSPVAGSADAILVPDIVSGNAIFKSLVYLGGGCAAGVVLGAGVPILLTSRADPAAARLASVALAAITVSN